MTLLAVEDYDTYVRLKFVKMLQIIDKDSEDIT